MSLRRGLLAAAVAAVVIAALLRLPVASVIIDLASMARDAGAAGVALFFLAYIVGSVAFVPGSILTLAAGFAYGPVWGLLVASPASVAGATAAFLLGRSVLARWASATVGRSERAQAIGRAVEREGFTLVLLLRLSPVFPFNALNYLLSLTPVRPATYVLASFIGMLPGTALYVYLGSLAPAAAELTAAGTRQGAGTSIVYAIGLAATVAVVVIVTRIARRAVARRIA